MSANLKGKNHYETENQDAASAAFRKRQFESARFSALVMIGAIVLMALAFLGFWISR